MFLRVTCAVMEPEATWGWGGMFLWLTYPESHPLRKSKAATQTGQEPGGRNWFRGHGGVLLTGLLILLSYRTQDHQPRVISPTVGWAILHQSLIKKIF